MDSELLMSCVGGKSTKTNGSDWLMSDLLLSRPTQLLKNGAFDAKREI